MSIEEVYARTFVTAAALAAVVAFLVVGAGILWRKRVGAGGLGIVGGCALALAWIAAHLVFRGAGVWADVARGGNGWKRALWPIEATERFHVGIVIAVVGGLLATAAAKRTGRGARALTWAVRIATIGSIAWVAAGPLAASAFASIVVFGLAGNAWWAALEDSELATSGALMPMTASLCSMGFGALMLTHYATTLGLVAMCGAVALCVVAIAGVRQPQLTRGPMMCAVITGGWVWLMVAAWVYAMDWPVVALVLACAAPTMPALWPKAWVDKRPKWNRWAVQLGGVGTLMGLAAFIVHWLDHNNPMTRF